MISDNAKSKIVSFLVKELNYVYCDSCANSSNEEYCEDCHRKSMQWSLSESTAHRITNQIDKIIKEKNNEDSKGLL